LKTHDSILSRNGYWLQSISAAPLAVFRIVFALMMMGSIIRFWAKGWIEELYIKPVFFFSYYGFEWVKPLGSYTYLLFAVCGVSALLVALGWFYRLASVLLFLSFTYIELMDKTTYLNHYYFVSIICFLLIFLPANVYFSIDAWRNPLKSFNQVPRFTVDVLRLMMAILYFYAGLAKVNSDWLLNAQPLLTWLPAKNNIPILGPFFNEAWVAYLFSWFGCLYDLTIPFWLSWHKSRLWAFLVVIVFHVLTAILFPIGMFPFIMIVSALIFFPASFHEKLIAVLSRFFQLRKPSLQERHTFAYPKNAALWLRYGLGIFFIIQIFFPFRYWLYPNELFWTEEGYRFSWRVMLMEKTGYAVFTVKDTVTGRKEQIDNQDYLTRLQEKQMSFQPDMILEFAHHIAATYKTRGWSDPAIHVENYVTLNGRPSQLFIDSTVNLAKEKESFLHKKWILSFNDDIKGF
jgi:hypothetical protein